MQTFNNEICSTYDYKYIDLFVPNMILFKRLCSSYDKTAMFVTSFIRLIMSYITGYYLSNYNMVSIICNMLIIINAIILLIVIIKVPVHIANIPDNYKEPTNEPEIISQMPFLSPTTTDTF